MVDSATLAYKYNGKLNDLRDGVIKSCEKMALSIKDELIKEDEFRLIASQKINIISTNWPVKFEITAERIGQSFTLIIKGDSIMGSITQSSNNSAKANELLTLIKIYASNETLLNEKIVEKNKETEDIDVKEIEFKICHKCQYMLPLMANYCRICGKDQSKLAKETDLNINVISYEKIKLINNEKEDKKDIDDSNIKLKEKEINENESAQLNIQLQKAREDLELKIKEKEIYQKKIEQEQSEEIDRINESHQRVLVEQKIASESQEIERQAHINKLELEKSEAIKDKEAESKRLTIEMETASAEIARINAANIKIENEKNEAYRKSLQEKETASAEIARINAENIRIENEKNEVSIKSLQEKEAASAEISRIIGEKTKLENEKIEYAKKYEKSQANIKKTYIAIFFILMIAGFAFYKLIFKNGAEISTRTSTPLNDKAKEVVTPAAANAETSGITETHKPIVKEESSFAPSFNCSKASTEVESLICGDRELSSLDVELNQLYKKAIESGKDVEGLKISQVEWRKSIRNKCEDKDCLVTAYKQRNSDLSN
jgi:uncharacterized protein YecT (DUF1311 family)/ribosomal protein L40E